MCGDIVGVGLVEVAPDYDHSGKSVFLAGRVLLDFLALIFPKRIKRRSP